MPVALASPATQVLTPLLSNDTLSRKLTVAEEKISLLEKEKLRIEKVVEEGGREEGGR